MCIVHTSSAVCLGLGGFVVTLLLFHCTLYKSGEIQSIDHISLLFKEFPKKFIIISEVVFWVQNKRSAALDQEHLGAENY